MSKARDLAGIFNLNPTSGTTAQRPVTAEVGEIYYNGTTGKTQIYTPTGWQDMASGIAYGNNAARPANPVLGTPYFNGEEKRLELYTSAGWQNIVSETPGVVSVSGNYLESVGSATFEITGTNFTTGAIASVIGTNGIEILATSTTVNSIVSASAAFTGLVGANEPYDLKITNTSNLFGLLPDAVYVNNILNWQTAAGSLGTFGEQVSISVSATAIDDSTLSYTLASGSTLPSGITLNSSTGVISGTLPEISTNTTYTFTINASDGLNPAVPRAFSIASVAAPEWNTSAGSLGSVALNNSTSFSVSATSPGSSALVYTLASGSSLPSGLSLSSTGQITGTAPTVTTDTTYTFTINVSDAINPVVPRTFSFIVNGPAISGGLLASDATYYYRVFKTNDNLVTNFPTSVDVLAVAGGGGGAQAGGGAGGVIVSDAKSIVANSYPIVVGTGGAAGVAGANTTCFGHTANGGGRGGISNDTTGGSGGSGGGSGRDNGTGGSATQGSGAGFTGYGFNGGNSSFSGHGGAGGGGGAGAAGANGTGNGSQSAEGGGAGGAGHNGKSSWLSAIASVMPSDWQTATASGRIAGGGGTTSNVGSSNGTSGAGGAGGGGRGFNPSVGGFYGDPGINHTGGGGGSGRLGGDGIVVIRYLRSEVCG